MLALKLRRVEVHINKVIRPICSLEKYFEKKYLRFKLTVTIAKNVAKFVIRDGIILLPKSKLD